MNSSKSYLLVLALILVFAGFLYFFRLDKDGIFTDEYFSLFSAQTAPSETLFSHSKLNNPNTVPPLYILLLHFWLKIFGSSAFAQRSLSALLGVLSVYSLYLLAKLLFCNPTGLLSALFGSLSFTWFCLFRQNRCYGLFILLALLSFYLFFYSVKYKRSKAPFIGLIIVNILLTYTHYFSFLIILIQLVIGFMERQKSKELLIKLLIMCFIVGLFYLPWYRNFLYDFRREPIIVERAAPKDIYGYIFGFLRIVFSDFHFDWFPLLTILYIPFLIKGAVGLKRKPSLETKNLLLYFMLILSVPFIFIYIFLSSDRERYFAPFMFPLLILLGHGIQTVNLKRPRNRFIFIPILALIFINNSVNFTEFFSANLNEEWREAARLIKQIPEYPGKQNVFIFQTRYNPPVFSYYYWGPEFASSLVDNISTGNNYEEDSLLHGVKEKIFAVGKMKGEGFFEKLESLPDQAWIWIFRYHDREFSDEFRVENDDRYFFHRVDLNKEYPLIDLYLLKKCKNKLL